MSVCDNCGFGPFYYTCPSCASEFEMMILLGEFRDRSGRILPPERKPSTALGNLHRLDALTLLASEDITNDDKSSSVIALIYPQMRSLSFVFPCSVEMILFHSARIGRDSALWLHAFLYAGREPSEDNRVGQIAITASIGDREETETASMALVEPFPAAKNFIDHRKT